MIEQAPAGALLVVDILVTAAPRRGLVLRITHPENKKARRPLGVRARLRAFDCGINVPSPRLDRSSDPYVVLHCNFFTGRGW